MPIRAISYLPLDELVAAPRNPKQHDEQAIDRSVGRFGYTEPLLHDGRTGRLVAGHGRLAVLQAMRDRGEDPPDGVVITKGAWTVPVVTGWASRSDAEAEAYLMASNRLVERGGWDAQARTELLRDLLDDDPELVFIAGFDDSDLAGLLTTTDESPLPNTAGPAEFPSYDENIPTQYVCPMCRYSWSGQPAPVPVETELSTA